MTSPPPNRSIDLSSWTGRAARRPRRPAAGTAVVGRHDQDVVVREPLVEVRPVVRAPRRPPPAPAPPTPTHAVDVAGVVGRLEGGVEQVRDAALPDRLARSVASIRSPWYRAIGGAQHGVCAASGRTSGPTRATRTPAGGRRRRRGRARSPAAGTGRGCAAPTRRRRSLVRALVQVDADGQVVAGPRRAAVAEHAHVPDLVADLADPRAVGLVAPQVGERRDQDVAGVRVAGVAVRLADLAAVADVVPGDAVLARERAGADRGVRARGHGGERARDRVAVVRALAHQRLEVRPAVRPVLQHVPAAAVDHERDDDLRWRAGGEPGSARPRRSVGPVVEADQRRRGRGEVGERDARRVVRRLDAAGPVDDQRDALEVHPDRGVAGAR